jgi:hypothetical protein
MLTHIVFVFDQSVIHEGDSYSEIWEIPYELLCFVSHELCLGWWLTWTPNPKVPIAIIYKENQGLHDAWRSPPGMGKFCQYLSDHFTSDSLSKGVSYQIHSGSCHFLFQKMFPCPRTPSPSLPLSKPPPPPLGEAPGSSPSLSLRLLPLTTHSLYSSQSAYLEDM